MKDPHIHAEKAIWPSFGQVAMRNVIQQATGLICDLPKTVVTGCGRRRTLAMCAKVPDHIEKITCLACLLWLRAEYYTLMGAEAAALSIPDGDSFWESTKITRLGIEEEINADKIAIARIEALIPKGNLK